MTARTQTDVDLSIDLAGVRLANPIMTASGTSGYGLELADFVDLSRLGAFTTKSVTVEHRPGNPPPRVVETRAATETVRLARLPWYLRREVAAFWVYWGRTLG